MTIHAAGNVAAPNATEIGRLAETQRRFFRTGATRDLDFRRRQLRTLRAMLVSHETDILEALRRDLGRPPAEAYSSEIAVVLIEIDTALRRLAGWARPKRARSPRLLFPASSHVVPEPFGSVLVIGPWNYPLQLVLAPVVAAIAAGNCAVVKPSELAPATSTLLAGMIRKTFDPNILAVVEGGIEPTQALLGQDFDYLFFTGGTKIGKIVMAAAAEHLTPVTLELGGKNPCIVAADTDMKTAARRIAWGKYFNAGQTCISPDFLLVERSAEAAFLGALRAALTEFYGADPAKSADYARIVNERHFDRLASFLDRGRVVAGGEIDRAQRYFAPTVIADIGWDDPVMADEIFGPVLPVVVYDDLDAEIARLQERPKPLALYIFTADGNRADKVLHGVSSGGASVNDIFAQLLNLELPFGGVGDSGMGAYHGKAGFDTFSHRRAIVRRGTWLDLKLKYPPYKTSLAVFKKLLPRIM
ncbi:aldehyde dehydrogenase [Oricola nitratireducens]|uniref:aldehyde dehydrogenase n=1 Tax=Oricola nitratireducens TaxID=2775868 RepID=UPI0018694D27|nr:aldehyde dehydrogenase [Oricola nitratireducens]